MLLRDPIMTRCRAARAIFASFVGAGLGSTGGCGGEAPVTQVPAVASTPPPPPQQLDISPVAAPGALLVSGALARPSASLGRVRSWAPIPMPQSEQATELLLGEPAGALVDLDQPVHFAVALGAPKNAGGPLGALEGGVLFAVSAGVQNLEAAKTALADHYKLVTAPNGVFLAVPLAAGKAPADGDDEDEDGAQEVHRSCELAPAYGAATYRLVCAYGNDKALNELGPWLTRGATRVPVTSDLHVDVRMQPVHGLLEGEGKSLVDLGVGFAAASLPFPSLREIVSSVLHDVADFALDLDTESLDVALGDSGVHATTRLSFGQSKSAFARLLIASGEHNGAPPAEFWRLPGDASLAGFARGIDGAPFAHASDLVRRGEDEILTQMGVPAPDRQALTDAMDKLAVLSPVAFASGIDADVVGKVVVSLTPPPDPPGGPPSESPKPWSASSQLLGWHVYDVHRPGDEFAAAVKALVAARNRPGLAAALRTRANASGVPLPSLRAVPMPKGKTWPKGAAQYLFEVEAPKAGQAPPAKNAKPKAPPKPFTVHVLVVPDGEHAWLSLAGDEATAAAKLAAASGGVGDTLGGRADLSALKSGSVGNAGFFTIRGALVALAFLGALFDDTSRDELEVLNEIALLPQHGASPWVFTSTASASTAPSILTSSVDVPRGAIDDLIAAVLHHGTF
jgi:hypothetical protein